MTLSTAALEEVTIASIRIGTRRRKTVGRLSGLVASIREHGLMHPILVCGGNELVAGARRLAACTELGWEKIPVRRVDRMSDEDLRAIELEENTERVALQDYEASKQRLAEIRQIEAKAREEGSAPSPARNPKGGRPKEPGSRRGRAEAAGVPETTVRKLERHVELAEKFPFMQGWPQHRVLEAGIEMEKLPEREHAAVATIVGQEAVPAKDAIRIINNLAEHLEPAQRKEIYAAAASDDAERRRKALCAAAATPPGPGPLHSFVMEAIRSLGRGVKGEKGSAVTAPECARVRKVVSELREIETLLESKRSCL